MDRVINKSNLINLIAILNLVFPIISIESLISWVLCGLSILLTLNSKNKYGESIRVALMFLIINGAIVMLLNYLQKHGVPLLFV